MSNYACYQKTDLLIGGYGTQQSRFTWVDNFALRMNGDYIRHANSTFGTYQIDTARHQIIFISGPYAGTWHHGEYNARGDSIVLTKGRNSREDDWICTCNQ